jgi:alkanesulfonate monooxygenase SsuD/methylene tetrahydromethanopterin reductase-like flavin-dependent oxidoreductase (luciferase family)
VELGVHLPLMEFGSEGQSLARLQATVDAARDCGFAAISANDHFVFSTPWLDGPTALAAAVERSAGLSLATTVALVSLRGPVQLARTLAALDVLSGGRLVAGVGPGSSKRDYDAVGVPYEDRWKRFEQAVTMLRDLLPGGIPLWIGSWGSAAGLRRVARLADGWLASAYNTTPERFAAARELLADGFPNALATMWTWVTEDRAERDRVLRDVVAPLLNRDLDERDVTASTCGRSATSRASSSSSPPAWRRGSSAERRYPGGPCGSSSPTTTASRRRGCRRCAARCSRSPASSSR